MASPHSVSLDFSPSPSLSSCSLKRPNDTDYSAEPHSTSRKRARTSNSSSNTPPSTKSPYATSEERKEARAHRNRIAAQNSRDRRKAHFADLERRVAELEAENQALRAGTSAPSSNSTQSSKDRENEELKERIRTLERGWDAVLKALAAQGLSALSAAPTATSEISSTSEPTTDLPPSTKPMTKPESPTTSLPVVDASANFPLSPAPTNSSVEFDLDLTPSPTSLFSMPMSPVSSVAAELDVPAAGGSQELSMLDHLDFAGITSTFPHLSSDYQDSAPLTDAAMDDLFREIIRAPPTPISEGLPSLPLPLSADDSSSTADLSFISSSWVPEGARVGESGSGLEEFLALGEENKSPATWMGQEEVTMQKILDMLPPPPIEGGDYLSHSDLTDVGAITDANINGFVTGLGLEGVDVF